MPKTRAFCTSNTVDFFLHDCDMPKTSSTNQLALIFTDLLDVLKRPHPSTSFLQKGTNINDAVQHLKRLLNSQVEPSSTPDFTPTTAPPPAPPPVPPSAPPTSAPTPVPTSAPTSVTPPNNDHIVTYTTGTIIRKNLTKNSMKVK